MLLVALSLTVSAAVSSVSAADETLLLALEARFWAMLQAERKHFDENLRTIEVKIDEVEGDLKQEKDRHLVEAKSNKWLTKRVQRLLMDVLHIETEVSAVANRPTTRNSNCALPQSKQMPRLLLPMSRGPAWILTTLGSPSSH